MSDAIITTTTGTTGTTEGEAVDVVSKYDAAVLKASTLQADLDTAVRTVGVLKDNAVKAVDRLKELVVDESLERENAEEVASILQVPLQFRTAVQVDAALSGEVEVDFELDEDVVREALEEQDWTYGFEINDVEPSYYDRQLSITTSVSATKTFDVEVDYSPGQEEFEDAVRDAVLDEVGADLGLEVDDIAILTTEAL